MSDSPSKRARERRKAQKRREKKARLKDREPEDHLDDEEIAQRYLVLPEDEEAASSEDEDR